METTRNDPKPKRSRGRPKGERPPLKSIVNFKGTPEYAAWLEGLATSLGRSQAETLEEGVKRLAREHGYQEPPSRLWRSHDAVERLAVQPSLKSSRFPSGAGVRFDDLRARGRFVSPLVELLRRARSSVAGS